MERKQIETLTEQLLAGELRQEDFLDALARPRTAAVGEMRLDLDRRRRCGFPEVIYSPGKEPGAIADLFDQLVNDGQPALATRLSAEQAAVLNTRFASGSYHSVARTFRVAVEGSPPRAGRVAVVTAGASDLPVAEEARQTLCWMNVDEVLIADVGVAGPHRLVERLDEFADADSVVVVAGMEGALPSVVAGYLACPVIAVPTSVGYGANFAGVSALLGMLNSCAANVSVVNIDAGFKGAFVAGLIARNKHHSPVHQ